MSRRKTIKPVDLSAAVDELLAEYGDQVYDSLGRAIKETTDRATEELRSVRKFSPNGNPSGSYSADWTNEQRIVDRFKQESVVYNESHYRLTHLLESGHSKYLWGRETGERVQGYEHIRPVNEKAQEMVVRLVREEIESI